MTLWAFDGDRPDSHVPPPPPAPEPEPFVAEEPEPEDYGDGMAYHFRPEDFAV